jgi:branched-chain amino acid transport system substrate-binding protein
MMTNNGGNDMISAVSVMGYDGYVTALAALQAAGSIKGADVMAALPAVEVDSVSGHIKFDGNGDAIRTSAFVKTVNNETGAWEFVAEQKVD